MEEYEKSATGKGQERERERQTDGGKSKDEVQSEIVWVSEMAANVPIMDNL